MNAIGYQPAEFNNGNDAATNLGWRYVLGVLGTSVQVESLSQAVDVSTRAVAACGPDADERLSIDIRPGRVVLTLRQVADAAITSDDVGLAGRISAAVADMGLRTWLGFGDGRQGAAQVLEITVYAADIPAIRPFWQAVLGYDSELNSMNEEDTLVDPLGQGPAVSFHRL
ncbi:4a-hydroxytetrahydrobiopterin dehydratase, partial [Phytoactinopolyspora endophytica]|uniref:4a-hydroxytetrahydrobiopterin dehydratase n=1 Tax=Phytoactinopolyspora endophytica TaxID=1642495 RepID=UPI0013E9DDF7